MERAPMADSQATGDYRDVPGTYVLDGEHCRKGYALNMFCMSLNEEANRDAFRADPGGYLDGHALTAEQRRAVLERDWVGMLASGATSTTRSSSPSSTVSACSRWAG